MTSYGVCADRETHGRRRSRRRGSGSHAPTQATSDAVLAERAHEARRPRHARCYDRLRADAGVELLQEVLLGDAEGEADARALHPRALTCRQQSSELVDAPV